MKPATHRLPALTGCTAITTEKPNTPAAEPGHRLLLIRHAKSSWYQAATQDFDRLLSSRGVRDGIEYGPCLAQQLPQPDLILCSPARRTRDTLAFLIPALVDPRRVIFHAPLYQASAPALLSLIREVRTDVSTLLVIAHNPGLTDLTNLLLDDESKRLDNLPTFGCADFALHGPFADLTASNAHLTTLRYPKAESQAGS